MYTILSRIVKVAIGIALLAMIAGRINAQGLVTERNLSMGLAKTIAEAAQAECRAKGYHTTVAVVDRDGLLLILMRDEKAGPHTIEMARRKAYTARVFRTPTAEFQKRTMPDSPIAGQRELTDILAVSGGVPIKWATIRSGQWPARATRQKWTTRAPSRNREGGGPFKIDPLSF